MTKAIIRQLGALTFAIAFTLGCVGTQNATSGLIVITKPTNSHRLIEPLETIEGIGVELTLVGDYLQVTRLLPGGPADTHGGLKNGDLLLGVEDPASGSMVDVEGLSISDVVDLIRGPKGTKVTLTVVSRANLSMTRTVTILRDELQVPSSDWPNDGAD